jgi:hypothetical protein
MQIFLRVHASTGKGKYATLLYCIYHVSILQYCNDINAQGILDSIWYLLLCELVCGNAAASVRDQCGIFWGAYFCNYRSSAVWTWNSYPKISSIQSCIHIASVANWCGILCGAHLTEYRTDSAVMWHPCGIVTRIRSFIHSASIQHQPRIKMHAHSIRNRIYYQMRRQA